MDGSDGAARRKVRRLRGKPGARGFRLEDYPFFLIARVDAAYAVQMEAVLRRIRVSRTRWRVLMSLRERSPRSVSEIASLTSMKLSTISRVVEKLRAEGLVSCASRAADNRVTDVRVEAPGVRALEEIVRVAARQYDRAVAGLSAEELNRFVATLRHIRGNLERTPLD